MIYVPMLKTRLEELSVSKELSYCFSDNIIPLFEILSDQYETRYKIDPITESFIFEKRGKQRRRVKESHKDSDIITLEYINKLIEDRKAFIDYFRFTNDKYGNNYDLNRVELAFKLSRDSTLYKKRLVEVSKYENLIPVVSIKPKLFFKKNELVQLLLELQSDNEIIGLRTTEEFIEDYKSIIKDILRSTDFLLFDIGEQGPSSKIMELEEVMELGSSANIILLNSPRKANIKNGEYENQRITSLIDNSARDIYVHYNYSGFGDYGGLKDALPSNDGGNGTGAALALIYDYNENGFYSFVNTDTSQGVSGYNDIIPVILGNKNILDPNDNCPAIQKIEELRSTGNWRTWNNVALTRYIHQIYYYN